MKILTIIEQNNRLHGKTQPALLQMRFLLRWVQAFIFFGIFAAGLLAARPAVQQESAKEISPKDQTTVDLSTKKRISERELKRKKEGFYITGAAGPGSSPDAGFGGSAILFLYSNGQKDHPLFPYTPYFHNVAFLLSYMSKGFFNTALFWDAPYFRSSPFRLYADLQYIQNPVTQYYGTGSSTMGRLSDAQGNIYTNLRDYENDLRAVQQGTTMSHYNYFYLEKYFGRFIVQRDLGGGATRLLGGFKFEKRIIHDYTNATVEYSVGGNRVQAQMGQTRLSRDFEAGTIAGFDGGWSNSVVFGVAYDTRDLEPYPRSGVFHDLALAYRTPYLGSDFEFTELTTGHRFYYSPFQDIDLVLAARFAASYKWGNVPFFGYADIQHTDREYNSMGGMRGYRESRFMGPFTTYANFEARYLFWSFFPGEQIFDLSLAPFLDCIRVFDEPRQWSATDFAFSYGAGLRLTWNQATVFVFDFAFTPESSGFYMVVRQLF